MHSPFDGFSFVFTLSLLPERHMFSYIQMNLSQWENISFIILEVSSS